jgi:Ca2+-binding RTX toxin-like protein
VVDTSGQQTVTRKRTWSVKSKPREQHLRPELTDFDCYQHFPLHGGKAKITVSGDGVTIPPAFSGSGSGGGGGGDYGAGDPTRPLGSGGCRVALVGTDKPDTLAGGDAGDVIFGLGAGDRIGGRGGHDCLIGGKGADRLLGAAGNDRLTGGGGNDLLAGGPGTNSYDAGPGNDVVKAVNGTRESILCGSGRDRVDADRGDRVVRCEVVTRH